MLDFEDYQWAKDSLKTLEFFSMCNDEEILGMVENLEKSHFKAGSTVLFQGEISNRLFLIKQGKVGIWKNVAGEKKMVAELGADKYFGEISLLTPTSATATVKAVEETFVFSLAYENLEFVFRKNPENLRAIQQKIEERRQANAQAAATPPAPPEPPPPAAQ